VLARYLNVDLGEFSYLGVVGKSVVNKIVIIFTYVGDIKICIFVSRCVPDPKAAATTVTTTTATATATAVTTALHLVCNTVVTAVAVI
jgi:hypothetical protein